MMIISEVYDPLVGVMMEQEGHPYLFGVDGEPYKFIGNDAAVRALYWQDLLNAEINVSLTVREAFALSRLVQDNTEYGRALNIEGCGDKLCKAVFDRTDKNLV